jgi:hypothetical protein
VVLLHVLPVAFVRGDPEEPNIRFVLLPALGREVTLALLRMRQDVRDGDQEVVAAQVANLLVRVADLSGQVERALEARARIIVGDGPELVLGDDTALVQAVITHLPEILGPHVIMVLVPSVVVLGVTELEAIEVNDDARDAERDTDEALPPLGDRAALAFAVLLVEDAARGDDGDHRLGDVGGARVIGGVLVASEEEERDRGDDRRVAKDGASLAVEPAVHRVDREEVRRRTHDVRPRTADDVENGAERKVHSVSAGLRSARESADARPP